MGLLHIAENGNKSSHSSPHLRVVTLQYIVTGVTADERTNADRAKEIGKEILTGMTGKSSEEYVFRKVNQQW